MSNKALEYFNKRIELLTHELDVVNDSIREYELEIKAIDDKIDEMERASVSSDNIFNTHNFRENSLSHNDELLERKYSIIDEVKNLNSGKETINDEITELSEYKQEIENNNKFFNDGIDEEISVIEGIDILKVQETERERIAADLHDSVVQQLTALVYKSEFCSKIINSDKDRVKQEINLIEQIARECITELRTIIYDLHPMELKDLGLKSAIVQLVEKLQKSTTVMNYQLSIPDNFKEVNDTVGSIILRNIRELSINSMKHSEGSTIYIKVFFRGNKIYLDVSDDGKGFDKNNEKGDSFGLSLLKERVTLLNGKVTFANRKEGGSCVKISLPIGVE